MKTLIFLLSVSFLFAITGCNNGTESNTPTPKKKSPQSRLYGYWRCEKPTRGGFHNVTFTEKEILTGTAKPGSSYMVAYDVRDNVIAVREAGTDHVLFTVDFIDDNKIKTTYDFFCPSGGVFLRSSQEETDHLNAEWKRNDEQKTRELEAELNPGYQK